MGLVAASASEGSGAGVALIYLAVAVVFLAVLVPLAVLIGRDATRHGRNGWVWGVLFVWQPVIVGVIYLIVRTRGHHAPATLNESDSPWRSPG